MMLKSIIFCRVKFNYIKKVIEKFNEIPQIKKVMSITGVYDIIAEAETKTSEELYDIFSNQIDLFDGIIETNTNMVLKSWEK